MRFNLITTTRPKLHAKKLKKFVAALGYDLPLFACLDLIAEMLGYRDYRELHASVGAAPPSLGDAFVDDATVTARRRRHIAVLVDAGLDAGHAAAAVDAIGPTDYGEPPPAEDADDGKMSAFEREWGLCGAQKSVVVEIRKARRSRPG